MNGPFRSQIARRRSRFRGLFRLALAGRSSFEMRVMGFFAAGFFASALRTGAY
jgi:hypothetical protein